MTRDYLECAEVVGKTILALRIFKDAGEGTELQIDFPDGTCFTCCFAVKPEMEASVIRPGAGLPEVLRAYDFD